MLKVEQALILDPPAELHFKAPFTDVTTSYLNVTNPTENHICFKVKTTAPKTYCVRPNSGIVAPKETLSIAVMLQPFDLETADKSKHKFMVQSLYVPDGEVNQESLWRDVPAESLMNSKLKCVFDVTAENNQGAADQTFQSTVDCVDQSKTESKPVPAVATETAKNATKQASVEAETKKMLEDNKKLILEYNQLRQENSTLKEEGLRYRVASDAKSKSSPSKLTHPESQLSQNKVPISPFLIGVCVIVFVFGLLFGKTVL